MKNYSISHLIYLIFLQTWKFTVVSYYVIETRTVVRFENSKSSSMSFFPSSTLNREKYLIISKWYLYFFLTDKYHCAHIFFFFSYIHQQYEIYLFSSFSMIVVIISGRTVNQVSIHNGSHDVSTHSSNLSNYFNTLPTDRVGISFFFKLQIGSIRTGHELNARSVKIQKAFLNPLIIHHVVLLAR